MPYANAAYKYDFKPGQSGKLMPEFWITPFDYAGCEGPQRAVESRLFENKVIGISWAFLKHEEPGRISRGSFWNLSRVKEMYGLADHLVAFQLYAAGKISPQVRGKLVIHDFGNESTAGCISG